MRTLIRWAGDDPTARACAIPRRGWRRPTRTLQRLRQDPKRVLDRVFEEVGGYDDIVLVRDIPFYSHCEHHMVPFIGKAHIAYYRPSGVVGLSKLARLVDIFARRLQTQEAMTAQIAEAIDETLKPRGVAVMLEAEHMCMAMRGVRKAAPRRSPPSSPACSGRIRPSRCAS